MAYLEKPARERAATIFKLAADACLSAPHAAAQRAAQAIAILRAERERIAQDEVFDNLRAAPGRAVRSATA